MHPIFIRYQSPIFPSLYVSQLFFSNGSYQFEVKQDSPVATNYPYLRYNSKGELLDALCDCDHKEEQKNLCTHLKLVTSLVERNDGRSLHLEFEQSFWYRLAFLWSQIHPHLEPYISKSQDGWQIRVRDLDILSISCLNAEINAIFEKILTEKEIETEENSLKFANLTELEMADYKKGRLSSSLQFELSIWSDLAKCLFLLWEQKKLLSIDLPTHFDSQNRYIDLVFETVKLKCCILDEFWNHLIPYFFSLPFNLPIHLLNHQITEKVFYDTAQKKISLLGQNILIDPKDCSLLGDWLYHPDLGLFPSNNDSLIKDDQVSTENINFFLAKYASLISHKNCNYPIQIKPKISKYHLFFDGEDSLHIEEYFHQKKDKMALDAHDFGGWCFLPAEGFFPCRHGYFEKSLVVSKEKISDFIEAHKNWFNEQPLFCLHESIDVPHYGYSVNQHNELHIYPILKGEEEPSKDLGRWIYIHSKGFFKKKESQKALHSFQEVVKEGDVCDYVLNHEHDLMSIASFFSNKNVIKKIGLAISLSDDDDIYVRPEYLFKDESLKDKVVVFDRLIFIKNEGFYIIPKDNLLPEDYRSAKIIPKAEESYFLSYELPKLHPHIISIPPQLVVPSHLEIVVKDLQKGEENLFWWALLYYQTDLGEIKLYDLWKAMKEKKTYLLTDAGAFLFADERFNWLKNYKKEKWRAKSGEISLSSMDWVRLFALEDVKQHMGDPNKSCLLENLRHFRSARPMVIDGLKSELRSYQELGAKWLWFLYTESLSGFLCDEMGLGKTHQAMALMAAIKHANQSLNHQYLIVCPTSVLYHWQNLLSSFLPNMKVLLFYGTQRDPAALDGLFDVILTSYGILRSDKLLFSKKNFELAVFDELHVAKNGRSQIHKAISMIKTKMKLGLTGTPFENNISEVKALFDLIIPAYFPSDALFRQLFVMPIEKFQDEQKKTFLANLIKPFMLRRKKKDVLKELPEKTEEIAYCVLSEEQKSLYKQVYYLYQNRISSESQEGVVYTHIFSLISQLKQLCDHPALIRKNVPHYEDHISGKWELFVELLKEARESKQKVVVFSQYLGMLDIMAKYLKKEKIGFASIRGQTVHRKEEVEKFQNDPHCEVFLGSLQAAGVGIDLTAGSIVIHYDRWWNPAKENQATDRVHRIGQNRGVQVFKMVTKDTIEEHIHNLIQKKVKLMNEVIGFDEHDQLKSLKKEDLFELMQLLKKDIDENPAL
ncbi:MAG: DEAD/DEAH box helicase [Rhabdochlamydiaceae bacterium]